ncbi:MAG TPA: AAA family ATPase [Abditibacteriaceae bacterium]|jgi:DNA polymerase III delta prime subunit
MLASVRRCYPAWRNFSDPAFLQDEIDAKQSTVIRAQELLSAGSLQDLIEEGRSSKGAVAEGRFDEFIHRLEVIGQHNNLLWRKVPASGDLGILYRSELDKPTFCLAVYDLLYGSGKSPARMERYLNYVRAHKLPNKWAFPTYLLSVCHPATEIFVKPSTIQWFLQFIGKGELWKPTPSAAAYADILELAGSLKKALKAHKPQDMVDIQSFIWVARSMTRSAMAPTTKTTSTKVAPMKVPPPAEPIYSAPISAPYSLGQCAADTGMDEDVLSQWMEAIERKGQAILYGPPGTGKTFLAMHLARHLCEQPLDEQQMGEHEESAQHTSAQSKGFWELVQFHPGYAYEDFLQGIRPRTRLDGSVEYSLVPGRFLEFCRRAEKCRGRCVLIIDEINRADLAQVLGELMLLLEYREQTISLAGGGDFRIPLNVRLLGTMNTANRSIALLDQALRRRFVFLPVPPNFGVLRRYHAGSGFSVEGLIQVLKRINREIGDAHYALGITFFLVSDLTRQIQSIWHFEIEPYLEESFFDRPESVDSFRWEQVKSLILL